MKAESTAYRQLWRVTDGAVKDAFTQHPDYLTNKGLDSARRSIVKRVTGAVISFAAQSAKRRSGSSPAPDKAVVVVNYDDRGSEGVRLQAQPDGLHRSSGDAWKKPGQALQTLIKCGMEPYPSRNRKGQFRHLQTPREIILALLKEGAK